MQRTSGAGHLVEFGGINQHKLSDGFQGTVG